MALASNRTAALAAFETLRSVLQHPRCQNRHIPGDAPLQLDEGVAHAQNVQRGLWGWSPGVGPAPVAVPHDALVAAVDTWIAAGTPCPPAGEGAKRTAR